MRAARFSLCLVSICSFYLAHALHAQSTGNPPEKPITYTRKEVTDILADARKIVSDNGIEELLPLQVNGTTQWISVRGRDRGNPILLYLHGGPGSPTMPEAYLFQAPWEDFFTVVQWDQRGTGKTYAANDAVALAPTITIDQMDADAAEVIQQLRTRYHKEKIFLLGHSWGSALGLRMAQAHPDWLYAYIGVGQMVDAAQSEADGYSFAIEQARAHHNQDAVRELEAIAPYPGSQPITIEHVGVQRKWLMYYGGLAWGRTDFMWVANAWELSPDYTDKELDAIGQGSLYSLTHLLPVLATLDYTRMTIFRCPIFMFTGRHDYDVSNRLTADWFEKVRAPHKKLVWFENSAHLPMLEEPGQFLMHLVTDVRPMAAPREKP
jgi:pimeloyl-ACP methyl ester carboxylesterase